MINQWYSSLNTWGNEMPFTNEVLLILIGAITSYLFKAVMDKKGREDLTHGINELKSEVQLLREDLIRNEIIKVKIQDIEENVEELYEARNKIVSRVDKIETKLEGL